jgi:holin-like protein
VKETAKLLIEVMPMMFIPAGVGLMESWGELQPILIPVVGIMVISTVLVMGVSGRVTQGIIRGKKEGAEHA